MSGVVLCVAKPMVAVMHEQTPSMFVVLTYGVTTVRVHMVPVMYSTAVEKTFKITSGTDFAAYFVLFL